MSARHATCHKLVQNVPGSSEFSPGKDTELSASVGPILVVSEAIMHPLRGPQARQSSSEPTTRISPIVEGIDRSRLYTTAAHVCKRLTCARVCLLVVSCVFVSCLCGFFACVVYCASEYWHIVEGTSYKFGYHHFSVKRWQDV